MYPKVAIIHYLVPMSLPYAGVTYGRQQWQMLLELVNLCLSALCHIAWTRLIRQGLGEFVHGAPHVLYLCVYCLSIQILEWTWSVILDKVEIDIQINKYIYEGC
jgi:Ca2+/H+ antiporter